MGEARRTTTDPLSAIPIVQMAKALVPPAAGSTATNTCLIGLNVQSGRSKKRCMSVSRNARVVDSALTPMLSLSSIAGSPDSSFLIVSNFLELSHLGISAVLCVQRSGWSVAMHLSHTSEI